jgi:DNA-binding NarL/FixJ family response regulator
VISVLIVDDHGVVREGLRRVLDEEEDIRVCAEAADGEEVLPLIEDHGPDMVILDITMPRLSGLECLDRLKAKHPLVKTLLLSVRADPPLIRSAVSLGADGYLLKNASPAEIVTAVRTVMGGGRYFSPHVSQEIIDLPHDGARRAEEPFALLSPRELEVLRLIAEGLAAKEIATELGISTKTVEAHRTSLMRKLGVRKATELVRFAVRHGLIEA